ncbi:hypothetical protein NDU88_001104 [Pleurodeles waltl]|uniref:Uncharacterized protein n=1 Tax=Pleurodeles waltl TaxID=8319 RepID=A0AAV7L8Q2_PLEWA|nr:hypothetical protein NDU88_001104 [Pleurodeles waltl]
MARLGLLWNPTTGPPGSGPVDQLTSTPGFTRFHPSHPGPPWSPLTFLLVGGLRDGGTEGHGLRQAPGSSSNTQRWFATVLLTARTAARS